MVELSKYGEKKNARVGLDILPSFQTRTHKHMEFVCMG